MVIEDPQGSLAFFLHLTSLSGLLESILGTGAKLLTL